AAQRGLSVFYGAGNCASCHSGWLHTDQAFHAIGVPQFGPGKAARFESHQRDEGRLRVTGDKADRYRFRTPSLRNVALTAPYGHTGAFATLEGMIAHHADVPQSIAHYDTAQAVLPRFAGASRDWEAWSDGRQRADITAHAEIQPVSLTADEVSDLVAFLHSLTDTSWQVRGLGVPDTVPSGLPVDQ
ncbi:MAG: cytochrome-c peroxidase, partial [Pseudomonadota bacterium]